MGRKRPGRSMVGGLGKLVQVIGAFLLCVVVMAVAQFAQNLVDKIRPGPTSTPQPPPTATAVITRGVFLDLLRSGKIEIRPKVLGIDELQLDLRPLVEELLEVEIPAGTFFVSHTEAYQNMVVIHTKQVVLETNDWVELLLKVACANMHRQVPPEDATFDFEVAPPVETLQQLLQLLDQPSEYGWEYDIYPVEQAAIWILTDDATYEDLGTLQRRSSLGGVTMRMILEADTVRAMQLIQESGLDITQRAIWQDRERLQEGLPEEPALREWLLANES